MTFNTHRISVLEPERTLLLAEKGVDLNDPNNSESIVAHERFLFIGTMNPSGDFGKKELSPALRNRFSEIWCEACTERNDIVAIIEKNARMVNRRFVADCMVDFIEWLSATDVGKKFTITIRDILTWLNFINTCQEEIGLPEAYIHGACLTFLDSLGCGCSSEK